MPNRIVRENILTSDRMPLLAWAEEVFYRRLMSVVDDYGRFDGRTEILRSRLYPLQLDKVGTPDIEKWIRGCVEAALVRSYTVDGKPFVEILRFGQPRRSASKYPDPPIANNCAQVKSNAPVFVSDSVSDSVSVCGSDADRQPANHSQSARTSILDRFARLLNKPSTQINWGPVVTWLTTVEQDGQMALASECLDHALQTSTSTPQTTQGAVKYVAAIYERCRQHDCKPGEFKPPDTGSPLAAKAKSVLDEIFNGSTK